MIIETTMILFLLNDVGSKLVLIIFVSKQIFPSYSMPCSDSLKTMKTVLNCPRNEFERNVRATLYNCSSFEQTCVEPNMFEYHCVWNQKRTQLIEVCAPAKFIQGQNCAEFNTIGCLIQESQVKCSYGDFPCPGAYRSTTTYNYQSCFDALQHTTTKNYGTTQATVENLTVQHGEEVSDKLPPVSCVLDPSHFVLLLTLTGYGVFITALFLAFFVKTKLRKDSTKPKEQTQVFLDEMTNEPSNTLNEE